MANLRDIKRRITSVESTKQITRTMEMVATAKIRRATDRIVAATPYATAIVEVLQSIDQRGGASEHKLLERRDSTKREIVICVASDKGLAGGFNSNVLRTADRYLTSRGKLGHECEVIACGKKAIAYFAYRKIPLVLEFRDQSADPTIAQAREIAAYIIDAFLNEKIDSVTIFFNHARNVADQKVYYEGILPIEQVLFHEINEDEPDSFYMDESAKTAAAHTAVLSEARQSAKSISSADELSGEFDYEPSAEAVLAQLLPSYIESRIYHALLDSAAGEQGARRKAMKAATDNAIEMVSTLTRIYNRVRQGAITTEITEIVGGAAAQEE